MPCKHTKRKKIKMTYEVELSPDSVVRRSRRLLSVLLKDCTLSTPDRQVNIIWATDDYAADGDAGHEYGEQISPDMLMGQHRDTILPRVLKHPSMQTLRQKQKAEVFTPAWLCNAQNNLVDEAWFGRKNVFNTETTTADGSHTWEVSAQRITFPQGRTWMHYVRARRLEVACGEAPYLASRYDAVSGEPIPIGRRVGLLDRKFRVINENVDSAPTQANRRQWLRKAYQALQSVYGYDWQGDNVFLARESLLCTFHDYYLHRWRHAPNIATLAKAAEIVAWNVWQMDGTDFAVPHRANIGRAYCKVMEWHSAEPLTGTPVLFKKLIEK